MELIIQEIIKKQTRCYFISPHLDDAVLSAGQLLSQLAKKTPVFPITVFTDATNDRPTLSAKQFLKYTGYHDAVSLFKQRKKEDESAMHMLGLRAVYLGYVEALWRKNTHKLAKILGHILPEFAYVYPVYRYMIPSGHVSKKDEAIKLALQKQLEKIVGDDTNYYVFIPFGIGGHVDHILVRQVCEKVFKKRVVYWSDFPYNIRKGNFGNAPSGYHQAVLSVDAQKKNALIKNYTSQVAGLFSGAVIPKHTEVYFIKN